MVIENQLFLDFQGDEMKNGGGPVTVLPALFDLGLR